MTFVALGRGLEFLIVWAYLHYYEIGCAIFFATVIMLVFCAVERNGGDDDSIIY